MAKCPHCDYVPDPPATLERHLIDEHFYILEELFNDE